METWFLHSLIFTTIDQPETKPLSLMASHWLVHDRIIHNGLWNNPYITGSHNSLLVLFGHCSFDIWMKVLRKANHVQLRSVILTSSENFCKAEACTNRTGNGVNSQRDLLASGMDVCVCVLTLIFLPLRLFEQLWKNLSKGDIQNNHHDNKQPPRQQKTTTNNKLI